MHIKLYAENLILIDVQTSLRISLTNNIKDLTCKLGFFSPMYRQNVEKIKYPCQSWKKRKIWEEVLNK
jgi:hypothetical protein